MPFTPFHFGPGAALHALAPRKISFLAFCAANVIIDIEPGYYMLSMNPPLHRFFHTLIGATLVAAGSVLLYLACRRFATRRWFPDLFAWKSLTLRPVVNGALLGAWSHILLDCMMHSEIRPFYPFSHANPLLDILSDPALHLASIAAGLLGGGWLGFARWRASRRT